MDRGRLRQRRAGGDTPGGALRAPCTVNKSYLAPYDGAVAYTPNLARFARGARIFDAHQTEAGQSGIAYASLFSGTQATRHGIFGHPTRIDDAVLLISESFQDAGYDVFFWNRQNMASPELGYAQGVPSDRIFSRRLKGTDPDLRKLLDELEADPSRRALVVANFHVSHYPYPNRIAAFRQRFPEAYAEASAGLTDADLERFEALHREHPELRRNFPEVRARLGLSDVELSKLIRVVELLYASDVSHLDGLFGSVLHAIEQRGLLEESAIVFTADHGEVLYRENALYKWSHGFQLAPEVLGVPLMVRAPGVEPGRVDFVTRSIDVFPTLAGLAGVPIAPERVEGVDLAGFLRGTEPAHKLLAYSHTSHVRSDLVRRAQSSWSLFAGFFPSTDILASTRAIPVPPITTPDCGALA